MSASQTKIPTKPKGFGAVTASISVANIPDAIAFYSEILGAETVETLMVPGTETVVYATIKVAGTTLVLNSDETALAYNGQSQVTLHHYLEDIEAVFEKATNNGAVVVSAIAPTWWGDMSALLVDPFGVRWSLAQRTEQLNAEQRQKRFAAMFNEPIEPAVEISVPADTETDVAAE